MVVVDDVVVVLEVVVVVGSGSGDVLGPATPTATAATATAPATPTAVLARRVERRAPERDAHPGGVDSDTGVSVTQRCGTGPIVPAVAVPAAGAPGEVPQPFEPTTLGRAAIRR